MRTLQDYENRIDHLHQDGTISCKLYNTLKERVGNMIGRKYEHESFLEEEKARDIMDTLLTIDEAFYGDDIVEYAYLSDFLSYVGK